MKATSRARWVCDLCETGFDDRQECLDHEKKCKDQEVPEKKKPNR